MTSQIIALIATLKSNKPIIGCERGWFTSKELATKSNALAGAFQQAGILPKDHILILQKNCHFYTLTPLALWQINAIPIPLYLTTTKGEFENIYQDTKAAFVIVDNTTKNLPILNVLSKKCKVLNVDELLQQQHTLKPLKKAKASDIATIIFTSGSSGKPKGVLHSHRSLYYAAANYVKTLDNNRYLSKKVPGVMFHNLFPLTAIIGYQNLIVTLLAQNRTYIYPTNYTVQDIANSVQKTKAQVMQVPAWILREFVYEATREDKKKLRSVECWITSGSAFTPEEVAEFEARIHGKVYLRYGLTEAAGIFLQRPNEKRLGVGKPIYGCKVKITKAMGWEEKGVGEIIFKTNSLCVGYLGLEKEWRKVYKNGWFHTGDIGTYDEFGNLHILGRSKNVIMSGAYTVWVPEVERVVRQIPGVKDCYIFAVPDDIVGEVVAAAIIRKPHATLDWKGAREFCKEHLFPLKIPSLLWITDKLEHSRQKITQGELQTQLLSAIKSSKKGKDKRKVVHKTVTYFLGTSKYKNRTFNQISGDPYVSSAICWQLSFVKGEKIPNSDLHKNATVDKFVAKHF